MIKITGPIPLWLYRQADGGLIISAAWFGTLIDGLTYTNWQVYASLAGVAIFSGLVRGAVQMMENSRDE